MSDKIYIGSNVSDLDTSPAFLPFSKVVIIAGEDENGEQLVYEAGDDTGRTLEVENPWGTQQMAEDMLERIRGYAYQPFSAADALLDPAAELGDAVTVGGVYSVLAEQDFNFNALGAANISAPSDGEIDHEFPYEESSDRQIKRRIAQVQATLRVAINEIIAFVEDDERELSQTLRIAADGVTVTNAAGSTFYIDGGQLKADSVTADQIDATDLHVNAANVDGTLTANQINLTGAITWSDLDTNAQAVVSGAYTQSAQADAKAQAAQNTISGWTYPGSTEINGQMIRTGTVEASYLRGGYVYILDSNGGVLGVITVTGSSSSPATGAIDLASYGALRLTANIGDTYISANNYVSLAGRNGNVCYNNIFPALYTNYSCGTSSNKWSDVYAINGTIQTSDAQQKKDIAYGLDEFDAFFDSLNPCTYRFIDGHGRKHFGLIAQDVEQMIEACGLTAMDVAAFIKSPKDGTQGFDYALRYTEFIPLLIAQVQALKKEVRELKQCKS